MSAKLSLIGHTFGKLKVIEEANGKTQPCGHRERYWKCICECGAVIEVVTGSLRGGRSKSCGCVNPTKHGHLKSGLRSRTYRSWESMKERCNNPNNTNYPNYGGRGISVCGRWINSFENFLADMGERPEGKTLERINNKTGNYEPSNCIWATSIEQCNNRRSNRHFTVLGKSGTLSQLCREFAISKHVVWSRISEFNWSVEKAFLTPIRPKKPNSSSAE